MVPTLEVGITLAVVLGIFAQWVAWRFGFPAIVLLAVCGITLGPGLGVLNPTADFGPLYHTLVGLAVAIILFEGGFSLKRSEIEGVARGVLRLISLGVVLGWIFASLAAHYIAELAWPLAITLGAILVVTGPTVVGPLLRHAKLSPRPASLFKWEGIINDPLGALLAILSFEYALGSGTGQGTLWDLTFQLLGALIFASLLGGVVGWALGRLFRTGLVPEFLKAPGLLAFVMLVYVLANSMLHEAGLLAATAMGLVMGNMELADALDLRRFKENIVVFLITLLFVVLTADIEPETLAQLDWRSAAFVGVVLFAVRPAAVMLSTLGSSIRLRERLLLAWIAPRGVVAAAMAGILGQNLARAGYEQANLIFPLVFAIILITVLLHGLTIRPLARKLGLTAASPNGLLLVGASPWSIQLAQRLHEEGVRVILADSSAHRLHAAQAVGVPTHVGEILSELGRQQLDLAGIGNLLAATDNPAYNALVCTRFAHELGRRHVFQLPASKGTEEDTPEFSQEVRGRTAFSMDATYDEMTRRYYLGWHFDQYWITGSNPRGPYCPEGSETLLLLRRNGELILHSPDRTSEPRLGDRVICYIPAPEEEEAPEEPATTRAS
ncbi:cation:proton antiporter [Thiohalorhabdus sp. Cl-TMA]|uniref:Cation:proton antiporter n=1 Tax=Thiohalorhabdus methylotrophus TaxID=3242694 RepID=A0ABV4TXQ3_9GAMM